MTVKNLFWCPKKLDHYSFDVLDWVVIRTEWKVYRGQSVRGELVQP
jgi:hypothetical protein